MTKKIKCNEKPNYLSRLRVRVVKAPLVDTFELRRIIGERAKAVVL